MEGDGLAADLVEGLHTDDVAGKDDEGREEATLVGVTRDHLEGAALSLLGLHGHHSRRGHPSAHGGGGLEAHAARLGGGGEGDGTSNGRHYV